MLIQSEGNVDETRGIWGCNARDGPEDLSGDDDGRLAGKLGLCVILHGQAHTLVEGQRHRGQSGRDNGLADAVTLKRRSGPEDRPQIDPGVLAVLKTPGSFLSAGPETHIVKR